MPTMFITLLFLAFSSQLFAAQSTDDKIAAALSNRATADAIIARDIHVLMEVTTQLDIAMDYYDSNVFPILKRLRKSTLVLSQPDQQIIDSFWSSFFDAHVVLHALDKFYRYRDRASPSAVPNPNDSMVDFIRHTARLYLLSSSVRVVRSLWNKRRARKRLDETNVHQTPKGLFWAIQNRTFHWYRDVRKDHGPIPASLFGFDSEYETTSQRFAAGHNARHRYLTSTKHSQHVSSDIVKDLYEKAQRTQTYVKSQRRFIKSRRNRWKLRYRRVKRKIEKLFYRVTKSISLWLSELKVKRQNPKFHYGHTYIQKDNIKRLRPLVQPGDIFISRTDWYLSNIFLPGFWKHTFIYLGERQQVQTFFDSDSATTDWAIGRCLDFELPCSSFSEFLAQAPLTKRGWNAYTSLDGDGNTRILIEAIAEGVVFSSERHTLYQDNLAVMRPRLDKLNLAKAITQAFMFSGMRYDFSFDLRTNDEFFCSELVIKSFYESSAQNKQGLTFDYPKLKHKYFTAHLGRIIINSSSFVEKLEDEHVGLVRPPEIDFVAFLRGNRKTGKAELTDLETFYKSRFWGGWSFLNL